MVDEIYKTPEENLDVETESDSLNKSSQRLNRINFSAYSLILWVYAPIMVFTVLYKFGINIGLSDATYGEISGTKIDPFALWFIQLPIMAYFINMRVRDIGIHLAWTIVFLIPVLNLMLFFWRGDSGVNRHGISDDSASLFFKFIVWMSPIVTVVLFFVANSIISETMNNQGL